MARGNGRNSKMYQIATAMMANINLIRKMDMAFLPGKVAMFTKATTKMMKEMAMEKCFGLMVLCIKVSGKKASSMVLVK